MSPCRWDYIFTDNYVVGVRRVVSEDSDLVDQSFLLIGCTGWIVTARAVPPDTQLFQHIAKFY
jgi:polynucleotide 5'-kinase involved in rRNA processing